MFKIKHYLSRRRAKHHLPVIIGCIILVLGIVFLLWQKGFFNPRQTTEIESSTPPVTVSENYLSEAKTAMADYQLFLQKEKSLEEITSRRERLLSLTIAKENQSLHLRLVMVADSLIAGVQGDITEEERAQEMINSILQDYPEFKL